MTTKDYGRLMNELEEEFAERFPRSAALHRDACGYLVDGGSHPLRLTIPFPPRIVSARGGWVRDEDGHDLLDFWQGHMANVLGHNPAIVTSALARGFAGGFGLQLGMTDRLQVEVAEILCRRTGAEKVRLTTSGTLAGMYAVMLARAFTGRNLVLKVGGGWHGAQPWSLKGSFYRAEGGIGFEGVDTAGLPASVAGDVLVTEFNDEERLQDVFERHGENLACFVLEPMVGAGGFIPATREYLHLARRLTHEYGAILILDEVISGFRFRAGNLAALYGIEPDLAIYGKAIGGGMPVAAFGGRDEVMRVIGREGENRVAALGGTYCAHPASMLAAKVYMSYLVEHEEEVYRELSVLGQKMREAMASGFAEEGIHAICTGGGPDLPCGSSLGMVHFPHDDSTTITCPQAAIDPAVCDVALRTQVLGPAMLLEGVHMVQGHGSVATVHSDADMVLLKEACRRVARRVKSHLTRSRSDRGAGRIDRDEQHRQGDPVRVGADRLRHRQARPRA
jgi:glutamate-1-semialdehyde 2,1-aminomutase